MVTAVIIDDEAKVREVLKKMIAFHEIPIEILGEAADVTSGAELVLSTNPDVILLDVMLGSETSFEMLRKIGAVRSKVIFISGFEQYAIEAFKFSAIDYILKPVDPEELTTAILKVKKQLETDQASLKLDVLLKNFYQQDQNSQDKKMVLQTQEKTHIIQIKDILRCESSNNYTHFYLKNNEKLLISKPIKQYDELLGNYHFYRVHKSHLVNMNFVKGVVKRDGGFLELINSDLVPISSRKKEKILDLIKQMGVN